LAFLTFILSYAQHCYASESGRSTHRIPLDPKDCARRSIDRFAGNVQRTTRGPHSPLDRFQHLQFFRQLWVPTQPRLQIDDGSAGLSAD
jgi:hypothetical protein